jgi:hypothetical protein
MAAARCATMALALGLAGSAVPRGLAAQQTASVLVRVNVINVPVAPAAFDSLSRVMRDSVTSGTRARVMAHARGRGLRVAVVSPLPRVGHPARPAAAAPPDVLLVEYVAN